MVCGGDDSDFVTRVKETAIVRCRSCGLCYTESRLEEGEAERMYSQEHEEDVAGLSLYRKARHAMLHQVKMHESRTLLSRLAKYKQGGKMLDIGCSAGRLLRIARERGWETFGVEPSGFASAVARQQFSLNVFTGDVRQASYERGFFDLVTMIVVFSHLANPVADFHEVNRILDDDGVFAFVTGNHDLIPMDMIGDFWGNHNEHITLLNDSSLRALLARTGFRLVNATRLGVIPLRTLSALHVPRVMIQLYNRFPFLYLLPGHPVNLISTGMLFICRKSADRGASECRATD